MKIVKEKTDNFRYEFLRIEKETRPRTRLPRCGSIGKASTCLIKNKHARAIAICSN